jgi:hypothetical protein
MPTLFYAKHMKPHEINLVLNIVKNKKEIIKEKWNENIKK